MAKKAAKAPAKKQSPVKKKAVAKKPQPVKAAKPAKVAPKAAVKATPKKGAPAKRTSTKPVEPAAAKPKAERSLKLVEQVVEKADVSVAAPVAEAPKVSKVKAVKASPAPREGRPSRIKAEKFAASEDASKWVEYRERYKGEQAPMYDMKSSFEAGRPLQHKLLGWGWVLSNENDRLEVLFQDGRRMLISNYNPER